MASKGNCTMAVASQHGLTAEELATMFVGERWVKYSTNGTDL
jgi:hypothetical protein